MLKMLLFNEDQGLFSLTELMYVDMINTEKITEYNIEVEEEFSAEHCNKARLLAFATVLTTL